MAAHAPPFQDCPDSHWLLATTATHAPLLLRDSPGGHTAQGSFRHRAGRLISAVRTGLGLKGCRRNEKNLFFSGAASSLVVDNFVDGGLAEDGLSFPVSACVFRFGSGLGSRTARSPLERDGCALEWDAPAPALATCEGELLELWLLAEPADEPDPPE
jgi:hypothetical protein